MWVCMFCSGVHFGVLIIHCARLFIFFLYLFLLFFSYFFLYLCFLFQSFVPVYFFILFLAWLWTSNTKSLFDIHLQRLRKARPSVSGSWAEHQPELTWDGLNISGGPNASPILDRSIPTCANAWNSQQQPGIRMHLLQESFFHIFRFEIHTHD